MLIPHVAWPSSKKSLLVQLAIVLILISPILLIIANLALHGVVCRMGEPGVHIAEPFRVDVVTRPRDDASLVAPIWNPWPKYVNGVAQPTPEFVNDCRDRTKECETPLNGTKSVFSWYRDWRIVRDNGIVFEQSWRVGPRDDDALRHARIWVAPSGSEDCIIPLPEAGGRLRNTRCIAGYEIPEITAKFALLDEPYARKWNDRDAVPKRATSRQWRWLGIEKHQHHLLKDGKLIARYVWYWARPLRNSGVFTSSKTCPANALGAYSPDSGIRDFWDLVLSREGARN